MNEHLQQLDALCRQPSMKVSSDQHATIVGNIVHYVMHPYFLQKSPEVQEKFRSQYLAHIQAIAGYCLREYVENSEPHLTIEFIKGLHRHLYLGLARVPVKTPDGSEAFMVPGELKTSPTGISRRGKTNEFLATTSPEYVARDMDMLLELLYDERAPLFQRYFRFMLDLAEIHPFLDGNGKLAMLLGDLFLLKQGIHPPYVAKYKWENEQEIYELAERYSRDPQRDISIFYPWAVKAYKGGSQQILVINKPAGWIQYQEAIKATLSSTFQKLTKNSDTNLSLLKSFGKHTEVIAKYCSEYFKMNSHLSTRFIADLHRMLYPPSVTIRVVQYDGVHVDQKPGEWRKVNFLSRPIYIDSSCTADIEFDLQKLLEKFNALSKIAREDILEFYCVFIRIHPFGDSNGTIAALICDIECFRQELVALNMLRLRFKDKSFLLYLVDMYDKNRTRNTLEQMLIEIDGFHDRS